MTSRLFHLFVGLFSSIGFIALPVQASEVACDCSCPAYERLLEALDFDSPGPITQVDQCGSRCAIAWVACEASQGLVSRDDRSDSDEQPVFGDEPSRRAPRAVCVADPGGFSC